MVCRPGEPCYSLAGKVIQGRSVPGYDYITSPQTLGSGPAKSGLIAYNGSTYSRNPGYGIPKTEAERLATHYARYGTTDLPPRGTGRVSLGGQSLTVDWGQIFAGFIIGVIFSFFVFSSSGRKIGYYGAERISRKLR